MSRTITSPRALLLAAGLAGLAALGTVAAPVAGAATATTKAAGSPIFCAQLTNSQKAIAAVSKTAKDRNARIAAEWVKIDRFAPAALKADTTAVAAAYTKAAKQTGAAATATLATIAAAGKRITDYATKSCAAPAANTGGAGGPGQGRGGDGDGDHDRGDRPDFDNPAFQACLKSKGVTMPSRPQPGQGRPGPGQGRPGQGQPPMGERDGDREDHDGRGPGGFDDSMRAAFEACRSQVAATPTTTVKG